MTTRILLCVENLSVRKAIDRALPKDRMEVVPVSNAELAKYLLDLIHPELVIAVGPPEEPNGSELNEFIRANAQYQRLPVIVIHGAARTFETFGQNARLSPLVEAVDNLIREKGEYRTVFLSWESLAPPIGELAPSTMTNPVDAPARSVATERTEQRLQATLTHEEKALAIVSRDNSLALRSRWRSNAGRFKWALVAALLMAAGLIAYQASVKEASRERPPTEVSPTEPPAAEQQPAVVANNTEPQAEALAAPDQSPENETELSRRGMTRTSAASIRTGQVSFTRTPMRIERQTVVDANPNSSVSAQSPPVANESPSLSAPTRNDSQSLTARKSRSNAPPAGMRKGGSKLRRTGEHIADGLKHVGIGAKNAIVWSGRKVGYAFRQLGKGVKKAFGA